MKSKQPRFSQNFLREKYPFPEFFTYHYADFIICLGTSLGLVLLPKRFIVRDGVWILDMPDNVEHKLDPVLAVLLTRGTSEGIVVHRRVQTLVKVVHGEVVKEDVAVRAVVDSRVANGRNGGGCHVTLFLTFCLRDRRTLGGIVGSLLTLQVFGDDSGLPVSVLGLSTAGRLHAEVNDFVVS